MNRAVKPESYRTRRERIGRWQLNVTSYRLGQTYYCAVDNVSPGAIVARGSAKTREAAEAAALEGARRLVSSTRVQAVKKSG